VSEELRIVLCTVPEADAERLATSLLDSRLCACVNLIGPVRSRYVWNGKIEASSEILLFIKTRADLVTSLRDAIRARHGYEVPEVLEVPASGGLESYLDWVAQTCRR